VKIPIHCIKPVSYPLDKASLHKANYSLENPLSSPLGLVTFCDLLSRLHNEKMAKNVLLEKQKSKAKFSFAVIAKYNVTFKTIEEKQEP